MFLDPEVDVVQSYQGGYGSMQTIPYLDFDAIAEHPKAFVGYSDITALHVALRQRSGLATFYGYGLAGMGDKESTDFSRNRLLDVLARRRRRRRAARPRRPVRPRDRRRPASPRRSSAAASGCCSRRWARRGRSTSTAASSSSRTPTRPPGTSTAC